MNRRSFLKSAALAVAAVAVAAVAVPVVAVPAVGLSALPEPAKAVPVSDMVWVVKFKNPNSIGHGTGITSSINQAADWYIEWSNQGYAVTAAYVPQSEARF